MGRTGHQASMGRTGHQAQLEPLAWVSAHHSSACFIASIRHSRIALSENYQRGVQSTEGFDHIITTDTEATECCGHHGHSSTPEGFVL